MGTLCQVHAQIPDSEEKHVFSINHNVGTNSLGTVTYSSVNGENPSESKFPDAYKGQPYKQGLLRTVVRSAMLTLSCTRELTFREIK